MKITNDFLSYSKLQFFTHIIVVVVNAATAAAAAHYAHNWIQCIIKESVRRGGNRSFQQDAHLPVAFFVSALIVWVYFYKINLNC